MYKDEDNRFWAVSIFMFLTALCIIVFFVSSCVKEDDKLDNKERIACISAKGDWIYDRGYGACKFNK